MEIVRYKSENNEDEQEALHDELEKASENYYFMIYTLVCNLFVVSEGTLYFQAPVVTDLAARDDLAFVTLLPYSPRLNPVEECWR